ncbi:3-phosphoserine/phosphohydroxythreonine transaminase [Flavihumibacter profundi]|uniref:3-phosphoserine/phosphohydroxythreonine transaminase n=1 Tax=Flavihumibacter profundi TaxID=2716883 RepID=UPI001CC588BC|nr:3-phosphoserine/phosphohydroxythreonine transaminase [Flavihumibacter profundi]MBZ5858676.1 3-phosphoserine/phosphohydroxythreonine transaminase [Flavihumibacter profundi]
MQPYQIAKTLVHNFNAGPSILPKTVFQQASEAVLNYNNMGLSILEIGHRTDAFQAVMDEAQMLVKELMQLDSNKEVLFLHGGASTQFFQVPMNLLHENASAAYLDCGVWGSKAIKEAKLYGKVDVVATSKDRNYSYIPKGYTISDNASYFHYTTNNTVEGTQMHAMPQTSVPLVADMSSDILSTVMDFNRFSLIYAGAQKNIGAAGVNLVIVDPEILGKTGRNMPSMMDYREHIKNGSMLNTPPVFAIYVCLLTLRWLKEQGGVPAIQQVNERKAKLLYETIDQFPVFNGVVDKEDRSLMNVVFTINDPEVEKEFLAICKSNGMYGVKGHRSVGGFRVSMYNALPYESVVVLTDLMKEFANKKG